MANQELQTKYSWLSTKKNVGFDREEDDGGEGGKSGSIAKKPEIDIERATRILNLCSNSLDEVKKAKTQVTQLVQYVEKSQQNAGVDWVGGIDRTKKLERFGRILDMLTSAIGKLEVLLSNMFKLTKGLEIGRGMKLGQGSSDGISEQFESREEEDRK